MKIEKLQAVEVLELDGELIILNQETFAVTKLNGTAGWIWEQLGEGLTQEQLTDKMAAEFEGIEREQISEDLAGFIDQMSSIGLIRRAG